MRKKTFQLKDDNRAAYWMAGVMAQIVSVQDHDRGITLDANDVTALFARELEHIDAEIQRTNFAPLKAAEFLEITAGGGPGCNEETYRKVTEIANAKWASSQDTDVNYADVVGSEYTRKVRDINHGYRYTVVELQNAALSPTIRLDVERKEAAVNGIRRLMDTSALIGDAALGWTGLFNDPNVPVVSAITGGWTTTATGHQIAADVGKLVRSVFKATKENYAAKILGVPLAMIDAFDKPLTNTSDLTVKAYVEKTFDIKIIFSHHLDTASGTSGFRAVAAAKGKDVARFIANQPFQELKPQEVGTNVNVPCIGRAAGTQVRQPLALAYMDLAA